MNSGAGLRNRQRLVAMATLLLPLSAAAQSEPPAAIPALTQAQVMASISVRPPDAFYDPPANAPQRPGALLRSEPLKGATLPAGMQAWRILYATSVDDRTPATAVATVFAPTAIRLVRGR
jgi:hypothetical protein